MKINQILICFLIIVSGISLFIFSGCGKKEPPIPPRIDGKKIAAPFDVKYKLYKDNIMLSWKHQVDNKKAFVPPGGFEIFMAKKTFDACTGCPFEFIKIGAVFLPSKTFTLPVKKGYKYYFRIQAVGDKNMRSDYSETILFEYP